MRHTLGWRGSGGGTQGPWRTRTGAIPVGGENSMKRRVFCVGSWTPRAAAAVVVSFGLAGAAKSATLTAAQGSVFDPTAATNLGALTLTSGTITFNTNTLTY